MSTILDRTLGFLLEKPETSRHSIRTVYLNNYFTIVELEDATIGACMSSYKANLGQLREREQTIRASLREDPLLLRLIQGPGSDGVVTSIRAAVINALSASSLRTANDPFFDARDDFPHHFFKNIQYAVVIGYGGLLEYLVRRTNVPRIHVSDLAYEKRRERLDKKTKLFREIRPGLDLSVSDGSDSADHLQKADFAAITGSTLTNGTLEELLQFSGNCEKIVLQGQSASIHPKEVFAVGVNLVITTIKNREVAKAAFWDPTGRSLRPLLEGGLPWIYLWPKDTASECTAME